MAGFQQLVAELPFTLANGDVWLAIGLALLFGGACLLFGMWLTSTLRLLAPDAPAGERLGVGLACGLIVFAAIWAAVWSGGRSSFTPVAVGFAFAIAMTVFQRVRRRTTSASVAETTGPVGAGAALTPTRSERRRSLALAALGGAAFVVVIALLYGSTMALSPRDGVQPMEKTDVAFYAILARGLAATGTEMNTFTSGFSDLPGVTAQTWYHWGELWLASAMISIFGMAPLAARYLVVLPLLLLAAGALTGTLVRRINGSVSRPAFVFGFAICLVLTPVPLLTGPFFSVWAAGLLYGIAVFGLAAVAVLFALYLLAVMGPLRPSWPLACFAGSAFAFILPAHLVVALLAIVGVGAVWTIRIGRSLLATRQLPTVSPLWRRTAVVTAVALGATVVWGSFTDHGLGGGGPLAGISPFNDLLA